MIFRKWMAAALTLILLGIPAVAEQTDLTELIEGQLFWYEFAPMPEAEVAEAVAALGEIADAYQFTGRVSTDGTYGYLLGILTAEQSPLAGMQQNLYYPPDGGEMYGLWPEDANLWDADAPEPTYAYTGVRLTYNLYAPEIIVVEHERYAGRDYYAVFNFLEKGETAYLADATARGVSVCAPPAPYLLVQPFVNGVRRYEYIRLTEDDVMRAMTSSYLYTPDELGDYAVVLVTQDTEDIYGQDVGVTAPLYDLAAEKCGFFTATPEDIGEVVSAKIVVSNWRGSRAQTVDDPKLLAEIRKILKEAEATSTGGCPYTGVLTLTMADGSQMVVQKASDSCGTIIFGSAKCYEIDRKANERFWEIFADAYSIMQ